MNLTYLLDDTSPTARNQCVLAQADAFVTRGMQVRIVTTSDPVQWRRSRAEWRLVDDLRTTTGDVLVAASPETARIAYDLAPTHAIQLVFGDPIDLPICKLPMMPIVDDDVYRSGIPREHEPMRVLLIGASQDETSGVAEGYGAAAHARWFHQTLDLVRVAAWAPSREEPLDSVQEFHVALTSSELTRVLHSCDVVIASLRREAPVGLDAAMALAAGVPVVATQIDAHTRFDSTLDFALFAPEDNPVEMGEKLIDVLSDEALRERLRGRGRDVAGQFRPDRAAAAAEPLFMACAARLPVR
ncbi:MAG TPA: glycosyltransferase [Thermoanaerobaculia bacterium]